MTGAEVVVVGGFRVGKKVEGEGKKRCPYLTSVEPTCFILSSCGFLLPSNNIKTDGGTSCPLLMLIPRFAYIYISVADGSR